MSDRVERLSFDKEEGERLDIFLTHCLSEFSRARVQCLIRDGFVRVNGETVTKTGVTLEMGDKTEIRIPHRHQAG